MSDELLENPDNPSAPQNEEDAANAIFPKNWREQVRLYGGRKGFIRQELKRLGFWPPSDPAIWKTEKQEAELAVLYEQLVELRRPLLEVEDKIELAGDVQKLIAEVRAKRIERRRAERAQQKIERETQRQAKREADKERREKTLPHLGRGVSGGLNFQGGEPEKVAGLGLPALSTAEEIAGAIGIETRELAWLSYHRVASSIDHYSRFTIPKKTGGVRHISSPKSKLRRAQSWLLSEIVSKVEIHDAAAAFRPAKSIVDNARAHAGALVVMRIDLKDFFPSIGFKRVKKMFQSFGYNDGVSTIFALLSTEAPRAEVTIDEQKRYVAVGERCLPQGACTSPAVTNILCRNLDNRLTHAAQHFGFIYTRYADDLIFSSREGDPKSGHAGEMLSLARTIIEDEKLTINERKVIVMRRGARQAVTGLVVNPHFGREDVRVSREDLRRFRAFLHQYEKLGRGAMTDKLGRDSLAYAAGYLSFIHMVSPAQALKIQSAHSWLPRWEKRAQ